MSSLYYDYLYAETKSILYGHDPKNYIQILSRVLRLTLNLVEDVKSKLKQDLIVLLGYCNGDFGVSTTYNAKLVSNQGYISLVTNEGGIFGKNRLLLSDDHSSEPTPYLYFNTDEKHAIDAKTIISSVSNDKYVRTSAFNTKFYYCPHKNVIASSYVKKRTKHLFYFFKDSRAVVRENKQTLRYKENITAEHKKVFIETLLKSNLKINPVIAHSLSAHSLIRYLSNPLWRDLNIPINHDFVTQLHVPYHRLSYHYKKYGTKKLREVYFGTPVKAIQNILVTNASLPAFYQYLSKAFDLKTIDINTQVSLLTALKSRLMTSYDSPHRLSNSLALGMQYLVSQGFSLRRLINSLETSERSRDVINYITDIPFMSSTTTLEEADVHITTDSISTIHDKFVEASRRKRDRAYYGRDIELTESELNYEFHNETYHFKPVSVTDELSVLGTKLSICVRSYDTRAIRKQCTIVGVYSKDTSAPICCIEINSGMVVQAKLHRNACAGSDVELNNLILAWAKQNKLIIRTYDLNENSTSD